MENVEEKRFADFDLQGRILLVTGGASGIGLALAEALVEAGGRVYCFDRAAEAGPEWAEAKTRVKPEHGGGLFYERVDVTDTEHLNAAIERIATEHQRLDGLLAAAGIMQESPAMDYSDKDAMQMMAVNYNGVLMSATAAARQMTKYRCRGSICIVASMSGLVANKGFWSCAYNSSKAALIQLARNLAMEWSAVQPDGSGGIRVNCLSPGHVRTPMVAKVLEKNPETAKKWIDENMMHRLAEPQELKSAGLFLLSNASSFMTGSNLVTDGGHTAW